MGDNFNNPETNLNLNQTNNQRRRNNNQNTNTNQNAGFFTRYFVNPFLRFVSSFCGDGNDEDTENEERINQRKPNQPQNKYPASTTSQIIEEQKNELRNLELMEQKRIRQEKERMLKEKKEEEEKMLKQKEIETKAEDAKSKLLPEPEKDDPNSTLIIFRFPDGERREERRFLKSHTIKNLYDFVLSFGSEIYTEPENNHFILVQTFPYKAYEDMNKTLEEEKLFPNAVLQIKEE